MDGGRGAVLLERVRRRFLHSAQMRGYALLSPTLFVMILFLVVPLGILFTLSFWKQDGLFFAPAFSFDNYLGFFGRIIYSKLLATSIGTSFCVATATVLLAYPMAYCLAFRIERAKIMWLILITVPFWTSFLRRVFAWKITLGYQGVINSGLMSIDLISEPLQFLLYNRFSVVVTLTHAWAAFAILPIYVSLPVSADPSYSPVFVQRFDLCGFSSEGVHPAVVRGNDRPGHAGAFTGEQFEGRKCGCRHQHYFRYLGRQGGNGLRPPRQGADSGVHHRFLPDRQGGDSAALHIFAAPLVSEAAQRARAGVLHPRGFHDRDSRGGVPPAT